MKSTNSMDKKLQLHLGRALFPVLMLASASPSKLFAASPASSLASAERVATQLSFSHHPPDTLDGMLIPDVTLTVEDATYQLVTSATNVVTLSVLTPTGKLMGTATASAINGTVTFSNIALTGNLGTYQLVATSAGLTKAVSSRFEIVSQASLGTLHNEQAKGADTFVDSVGINVHLNADLYYTNWPLTFQALKDLGVRHTRDGVIPGAHQAFFDRYQQLGKLGIKGQFTSNPNISPVILNTFIPMVSNSFEGIETLNEADTIGPNWIGLLKHDMDSNYAVAHQHAGYFIGPSLTSTSTPLQLGDVSSTADFANLHNYFGGRNPGTAGWGGRNALGHAYGGILYNIDLDTADTPGRPVITTETGYTTDPSVTNFVTPSIEATYVPRMLMEQWNAGIQRTYLYQLIDTDKYGLLNADGSRKPVFNAVSNLLALMSDPGRSFNGATLNYALMGGNANLHHSLFQKRDGSFWLALWVEQSGYNPDTHVAISVAPAAVTLVTASAVNGTSYQFGSDGSVVTQGLGKTTSHALTVTDHLMLVKLQ